MIFPAPRSFIILCALLATASCAATPDEQRQMLRSALGSAQTLSTEIAHWRGGLSGDIPASAAETIETYKARASELQEQVEDLQDDVTGVDVTDVNQALLNLLQFDASPLHEASPSARASLLDQFRRLSDSVGSAAARAERRMT